MNFLRLCQDDALRDTSTSIKCRGPTEVGDLHPKYYRIAWHFSSTHLWPYNQHTTTSNAPVGRLMVAGASSSVVVLSWRQTNRTLGGDRGRRWRQDKTGNSEWDNLRAIKEENTWIYYARKSAVSSRNGPMSDRPRLLWFDRQIVIFTFSASYQFSGLSDHRIN